MINQQTLLAFVGSPASTPPTADDAWLAWLKDTHATRCVLIEAQSHNGASVVTHYLANKTFKSKPTSSVSNQEYRDAIAGPVEFQSKINGDWTAGDIQITNLNGEFDDWLTHAWRGWPLQVYLGDPSWDRDQFRLLLNGISDGISAPQRNQLNISVRDRRKLLDVPALKQRSDGQFEPLCLGVNFNAKPILIDTVLQRYKLHGAAGVQAYSQVRDRGVPVLINASSIDIALGEFTLVAAPAGDITVDAVESHQSAADIIRYLAALAGYTLLDQVALNAFPNKAAQGLYITQQTNVGDLMKLVAESVGAETIIDRLGQIKLVRVEQPAGAPAISLGVDDIDQDQLTIVALDQPRAYVTLSYAKNWTVQGEADLAGGVTGATRQNLKLPYSVVTSQNTLTGFPLPDQPEVVDTLFAYQADAQAECARRAALRSQVRPTVRIDGATAPLGVDVGDVVQVTHPRFGLAAGVLTKVVGIRERPAQGSIELELWR